MLNWLPSLLAGPDRSLHWSVATAREIDSMCRSISAEIATLRRTLPGDDRVAMDGIAAIERALEIERVAMMAAVGTRRAATAEALSALELAMAGRMTALRTTAERAGLNP